MRSRFSRREFTQISGAALLSWTLEHSATDVYAQTPPKPRPQPRMSADDALKEMTDGNARFVKGELRHPRARPRRFQSRCDRTKAPCCCDRLRGFACPAGNFVRYGHWRFVCYSSGGKCRQ